MKVREVNRLCKICLDIAEYMEEKHDIDDPLCNDLGLGCLALSGYLRNGVKAVIDLQGKCRSAEDKVRYLKEIDEGREEFLTDIFGDPEPETINEKDKKRIKEFVQGIMAEWEQEEQ